MNSPEVRVLLIEDDENDYVWIKDMLSDITSARFRLDWISTYEKAATEICRLRYDVYLIDYRLGMRDGLELLRELINKGCKAPIIILTGMGDYGVDVEAMKIGAADYLVKGQTNADLLERSIRYSIKAKQMEEGLRREIGERKQIEAALRLDETRLEALLELSHMTGDSIREIADFAVEQQVNLTRSKIGWLGLLNEDETILSVQAWSKAVTEQCAISDQGRTDSVQIHSSIESGGVWADVVRNRTTLILNDYSKSYPHKSPFPEKHVALSRLMVVPVFERTRVVMLAAVANKKESYDTSDARQLTLLMDGMWKLIQREKTQKKLRQSENLAAIGTALSGVAHDLKTPLIAIGGFTCMVQQDMSEDDPNFNKLEIVKKETRRLESILEEILDFARPLELHPSAEDINRTVSECIEVASRLTEGKKVVVGSESLADSVILDHQRMKQALINLITNAVEASPEEEIVTIICCRKRGNLVLDVIDRGPGIQPEERDTVFMPFFTTKKKGTGLGLTIVKKIIEAHQGNLLILDNPFKGLTFRIEIPENWYKIK